MKYCVFCMRSMKEEDNVCPHCGKKRGYNPPEYHLLPGTIIGGKFMLGAALGEGGFGITYIGRDVNLDIRVAVKEYFPNGFANRSSATSANVSISASQERMDFYQKGKVRFLDEARTLAKFSGEQGVVDVRDFFECNNTAYIVMEFLEGTTLKDYVKKNGCLKPDEAVRLLTPVMESLKKVHGEKLIHRDISPDNIMVLKDRVKLLDFGAARSVSAEANKSLSVVLKPGYAPEEQYRSKGNQGPWTDVYAMSATIYKCITGITPDDSTQRMYKDEIKTPSALGVAINPAMEAALMKGLAVLQDNRWQDMEQLLGGLYGKIPVGAIPPRRDITQTPVTMVAGKNVPYSGRPGNVPPRGPANAPQRGVGVPPNWGGPRNTGSPISGTPRNTGRPMTGQPYPPRNTGSPISGGVPNNMGGAVAPPPAPQKKKSNAFMVIFALLSFVAAFLIPIVMLIHGYTGGEKVFFIILLCAVSIIPFIISAIRGVKKRGVAKGTVVALCILLAVIIGAISAVYSMVVPYYRFVGEWYSSDYDNDVLVIKFYTDNTYQVWNESNGEVIGEGDCWVEDGALYIDFKVDDVWDTGTNSYFTPIDGRLELIEGSLTTADFYRY